MQLAGKVTKDLLITYVEHKLDRSLYPQYRIIWNVYCLSYTMTYAHLSLIKSFIPDLRKTNV